MGPGGNTVPQPGAGGKKKWESTTMDSDEHRSEGRGFLQDKTDTPRERENDVERCELCEEGDFNRRWTRIGAKEVLKQKTERTEERGKTNIRRRGFSAGKPAEVIFLAPVKKAQDTHLNGEAIHRHESGYD
jgi:hypothetical protein